jgi:hypothetical protein
VELKSDRGKRPKASEQEVRAPPVELSRPRIRSPLPRWGIRCA